MHSWPKNWQSSSPPCSDPLPLKSNSNKKLTPLRTLCPFRGEPFFASVPGRRLFPAAKAPGDGCSGWNCPGSSHSPGSRSGSPRAALARKLLRGDFFSIQRIAVRRFTLREPPWISEGGRSAGQTDTEARAGQTERSPESTGCPCRADSPAARGSHCPDAGRWTRSPAKKAVTYFSIALNTLPEILKNAPAKC